MQEITAYKPKCCNRAYMSKYSAIRHERNCPNNPDNRACKTCKNYVAEYDEGWGYYCEHYEKEIDKDAELFDEPERYMEPRMNCEFWEGKLIDE